MRRAAKVDVNQGEIVAALRALPGVTVQSLATVGDGVPDLLVGVDGRNLLLEVKPGHVKEKRRWLLNANEERWHALWTGQRCVVRSVDEAVNVVTAARGGR